MFCFVTVVSVEKSLKSLYYGLHGRAERKQDVFIRIVLHIEKIKLLICVQTSSCCWLCVFTALPIECVPDRQQYRTAGFVCVLCLPLKKAVNCWYHITSAMNESVGTGIGRIILTQENRRTRRKTGHGATFPTMNPTWTGMGLKPGLRRESFATNLLNRGTVRVS